MIAKCVFKKKKNMEAVLASNKGIYAVDSAYDTSHYCYDGKKFGIVNEFMAFICDFEDVEEDMIKNVQIKEIKKELTEVYEDIRNRRNNMEVVYEA